MLIDLGDITDDGVVSAPPARPRRLSRRQAVSAGAVLVVTLSVFGAGGPKPADPLAYAGSLPLAGRTQVLLSGSSAVATAVTSTGDTISGYALPGARRMWTEPLTGTANDASLTLDGTTVIVDEPPTGLGATHNIDEGFDLRTGRRLWSQPSDLIWPTPAGFVIYTAKVPPEVVPGFEQPGSGGSVELLDPATGRVRWTTPIQDGCQLSLADGDGHPVVNGLVEMCPAAQELIGIDVTTGRIRADRHVDLAGLTSPYVVTIRPELMFAGADTIVAVQDRTRIVLSAFRTSDFTPLWTGFPIDPTASVEACGADVCINDDSGVLTGLDPITGARTILAGAPANGGSNAATEFKLVFGLTEFVVVPPGQAPAVQSVPATIDLDMALPAGQAWSPELPDQLNRNRDFWVAEQVTTGEHVIIRTVGVLHDIADDCQAVQSDAAHTYVTCSTSDNRLSFWLLG